MRLGAAIVLGVLTLIYLALAIEAYFFPARSAVASALVGVAFGVTAVVYALLTRAVVRQSRLGHILAAVVCAVAVVSISGGMAWLNWVALVANVVAFGLLLGSVPRRRAVPAS